MARLRRFERPTCRLGGGCSILLSYRRIVRCRFYCLKSPKAAFAKKSNVISCEKAHVHPLSESFQQCHTRVI